MTDEEMLKYLDDLAARPTRKSSQTQTDECPVWNPWDGCWMESDDQLRERIKQAERWF